MEIGTGSSDNGSLRDELSGFDRVQRRSNESQDGRDDQKKKVQKGSEHRVHKRTLSSNDTNSFLPKNRKKNRTEKTVTSTTSGYNLRLRIGKGVESRLTIQRKTQQGGPVRSRKGRGRGTIAPTSKNEQDQATRIPDEEVINNGKTRKGEERVRKFFVPGGLGRKRQLQVIRTRLCIVSFYILSNKWSEELLQ
ncbi:uncharacterized protein TNCV_1656991 [Trichonephila clavipes]|nr:uncharacterized protein TNCV_1656991 [Trichonephila clavipes]